ncbi:O-antigen ligase [Kaistia soli DSM 19436]|uniref:O-antigen ligase n=1 Tax=Kaistia soli DSM 19436 TaxID=1122133 RepID=A0A1M5NFX3_9HYPH|nr:O-antigen ligase family protein [Kaistia soli]SHG88411.1 O-antigen ligase [Kaistia soli DSM 19436]
MSVRSAASPTQAIHGVADMRVLPVSLLLAAAMVLGGTATVGLRSDMLLQLLSIPVLMLALRPSSGVFALPQARLPIVLMLATAAVMILQLVPLPPWIWTRLPGRAIALQSLELAGVPATWQSLSLSYHLTVYSLLSLLAPAAVFLSIVTLGSKQRQYVISVVLVGGLLNVIWAQLQIVSLSAISISIHQLGNIGYAIGSFSNRNHFSAMIYMLAPLSIALMLDARRHTHGRMRFFVIGAVSFVFFLLGLLISFSRAGIGIGTVAIMACLIIVRRERSGQHLSRPMLIGGAIAAVAVVGMLVLNAFDLLGERGLVDDARVLMLSNTIDLITRYPGFGSGFGTFAKVYQIGEAPETIRYYYINHAHNDWLEMLVEGGLPVAIIIIAGVVWLARRIYSAWKVPTGDGYQNVLAEAATISIVAVLLHSTMDYPLRTTALASIFALLCALVCDAPRTARGSSGSHPRHSSR